MPAPELELARLRAVPAQTAAAVADWRISVRDIRWQGTGVYTDEELGRRVDTATAETLSTLDDIDAGIQKTADTIRDRATSTLEAPRPSDTTRELLDEIRTGRAWDRVRRLADRTDGKAVLDMLAEQAADAAQIGDTPRLRAVREETDWYLRGRGLDDFADFATTALDAAVRPHLPAEQREALDVNATLDRGLYRLEVGLTTARGLIERRDLDSRLAIPQWDDGVLYTDTPESPVPAA